MSPTAHLRTLQPGWDSYGARAICPTACDRADALVLLLRARGIEPAEVTPTCRGGVYVEWVEPGQECSIEYLPVESGR